MLVLGRKMVTLQFLFPRLGVSNQLFRQSSQSSAGGQLALLHCLPHHLGPWLGCKMHHIKDPTPHKPSSGVAPLHPVAKGPLAGTCRVFCPWGQYTLFTQYSREGVYSLPMHLQDNYPALELVHILGQLWSGQSLATLKTILSY